MFACLFVYLLGLFENTTQNAIQHVTQNAGFRNPGFEHPNAGFETANLTNKQASKLANKQTSKQSSKQANKTNKQNKQTIKHTSKHANKQTRKQ